MLTLAGFAGTYLGALILTPLIGVAFLKFIPIHYDKLIILVCHLDRDCRSFCPVLPLIETGIPGLNAMREPFRTGVFLSYFMLWQPITRI